ncbi:hypothetical protein B7P43_G00471 [Cryptotermes secundus]|uniref:Cilia- and flagella-associated protein 44 n=1 Tax=Cryptotermes secundus TaxID=105785 RepID=A0A2J7R8P6_9NEOP|nr:hypothetical protein B7P43_G00471 [Cryptotermes secundus]
MSNATNGDAENLPEELSHAEVRRVEESGAAGKEQRQEEKKVQEEIPEILNSDDFISKPFLSKKCTVPEAILVFHHSFGYDCQRYFNLVLLEETILAFASGNLIHIFNVGTNELWFRRSAGGGGIGHMAKNPNPAYQHLAVAEKGNHPLIIIYNWPSLDIVCLLKQGAEKMYCHINYSPDGEMLCSQGGAPDYLLIVWNWKASKIILCCQSCSNDVYKAAFATSVPDHIITCGVGHINFWKVGRTFTGLKLTGSLGRFGRTEISDIIGFLTLPDGKVISGCEWGNMLLWEGGLIKVEVSRKKKKHCHAAPITQFEFENGDLTTVGMDELYCAASLSLIGLISLVLAVTVCDVPEVTSPLPPSEPTHIILVCFFSTSATPSFCSGIGACLLVGLCLIHFVSKVQ